MRATESRRDLPAAESVLCYSTASPLLITCNAHLLVGYSDHAAGLTQLASRY